MQTLFRLCVVDCLWLSLSLFFLFAYCFHRLALYLPTTYKQSKLYLLFQDLIRYGKTKGSLNREHWQNVFDIPKRWFWHFYAISIAWNGLLIVLSFRVIMWDQQYPSWLTDILEYLTGESAVNVKRVPQLSTLLVQLLLWVHSLRRLLECHFVSVFSNGVIHVVQYLFGLGYYILLGLTALCSDPLITEGGSDSRLLSQLKWYHVTGAVLFSWASLLQHHSLVLLARLRTGGSGRVETLAHRFPRGGWFELVSCPHYFAELLIYTSLWIASAHHAFTWGLVVIYVLFNQALAAQLCHEFYRTKFQSYLYHRKSFIPYLL